MAINEAIHLPDEDRFRYLINSMVKHRELWLLKEREGFYAMFEDDEARSYIPIWPDQESAAFFATDDWEGYLPDRMGIGEFLSWLDELKQDEIFIGAYPNTSMQSLSVDPVNLKKNILEAQGTQQ